MSERDEALQEKIQAAALHAMRSMFMNDITATPQPECGETSPVGGWVCTLPAGHEGIHRSGSHPHCAGAAWKAAPQPVQGEGQVRASHAEGFKEAAEPMMRWLEQHGHPHMQVVIDSGRAELFEGLRATVRALPVDSEDRDDG